MRDRVNRFCRRCLPMVVALWCSTATAVPAEIVIVVDTSASMAEPAPGGEGTRLALAGSTALKVAEAAEAAGHRVALVRFHQLETTVQSGEGPRTVTVEDEEQCTLAADLLVPMTANGAAAVGSWVDGSDGPGEPELTALGDSPLLRAVQTGLRYLRARRAGAPAVSCVNASIVVLTDGRDTCGAGSDLENALAEIREVSVLEDIRGLVLAFDATTEVAQLLAGIGHEVDDDVRPFEATEADALVSAVAAIEGRLAPEACVVSGVDPESLGLPPGFQPAPPAGELVTTTATTTDEGCQAGRSSGGAGWLLLALLGLALLRRRQTWVVLAALALGACGGDEVTSTTFTDVVIPDVAVGGEVTLTPPEDEAAVELARLDALVATAEAVRAAHLAPLLEPDAVFAGLEGAAIDACLGLVRGFGFDPYFGAQQGVRGCLVSRRCNAADAALVLQACLQARGEEGTLMRCRARPAYEELLHVAALRAPVFPDLAAAEVALQDGFDAAVAAEPELGDLPALMGSLVELVDARAHAWVDDDVARLRPLIDVDPGGSAYWAAAQTEIALRKHAFVQVGDQRLDPVLDGAFGELECDVPESLELETFAPTVTVDVVVRYALLEWNKLTLQQPTTVATHTWRPAEHSGELAEVVLADAAEAAGAGVPGPTDSGCLRATVRVGDESVVGEPFAIQADESAACPGGTALEATPGYQLARVALRTTVTVDGDEDTIERVLFDRYGYALTEDGAHASGPQVSAAATRSLLPMRVDLRVGTGLPGPHAVMDTFLADLVRRRDVLAARLAERFGVAGPEHEDALTPMPTAVLAALQRYAPKYLPDEAYLTWVRPWRMATVRRRGYTPSSDGIRVTLQTIFDIHDAPIAVVDRGADDDEARAEARLVANIALGALLTEAEGMATTGFDRSFDILNAGAMLRDDTTGPWAEFDSDDAHGQSKFPLAVREAWGLHKKYDRALLVTPGAVAFLGVDTVAWWKVDERTGGVLGEIRYDGTFYGGVVAVKILADFDACLWASASAALKSGSQIPDVQCCFENALQNALKDAVTSAFWGGFFGAVGSIGTVKLFSGAVSFHSKEVAKALGKLVDTADHAAFFAGLVGAAPCLQ